MAFEFDASTAKAENTFDPSTAQPEKPSGAIRRIADQGIKLAQGVVGVPEAAVGVADLVTGGQAGKLVESAGVRFKDAKDFMGEYLSPEQKAADAEVAKAEGFFPTVGAMVSNPSTIVGSVVESAPSMLMGGAASRGLLKVAPKLGAIAAGAAGEGITAAGQNAEQVRQEDPNGTLTGEQSAILAGSGLLTAGIAGVAGKVANKLGIGDVQTMLARGKLGVVGEEAAQASAKKGIIRKTAEGALSEGVLQEFPQSYQEQVAQNIAQGKPWDEGAAKAGAQGMLAGAVMGGGGNVISHAAEGPQPTPAVESAAPAAVPLQVGNTPDPYLSFPDGSVARRSEVEAHINSLPADQQPAARAKMMGLAPQPAVDQRENAATTAPPITADTNATSAINSSDMAAPGVVNALSVKPSEAMGLDPAAGPMSAAATIAVDTGVHQQHLDQQTSEADQAAYDQYIAQQDEDARQQDTTDKPLTHGALAEAAMSEDDKRAVLFSNKAVADGGTRYKGTRDGDILNGAGAPFTNYLSAGRRASMEGKDWTIAKIGEKQFVARRKDAIKETNSGTTDRVLPTPANGGGQDGNFSADGAVDRFDVTHAGTAALADPKNASVVSSYNQTQFAKNPDGSTRRVGRDHFESWANSGGVSSDVGSQYDGHGIAKSNPLGALLNILTNGINTSRRFDSAPLTPASSAAGAGSGLGSANGAYKDGPFILLGERGKSILDGIKTVLVSDEVAASIPALQQRFPDVRFVSHSNAQAVLSQDANVQNNQAPANEPKAEQARVEAPTAVESNAATTNAVPGAGSAAVEGGGVNKALDKVSNNFWKGETFRDIAPQVVRSPDVYTKKEPKFTGSNLLDAATEFDYFMTDGRRSQKISKEVYDHIESLKPTHPVTPQESSAANRAKLKAKNTPTIKTEIVPDIPQPTESTNEKTDQAITSAEKRKKAETERASANPSSLTGSNDGVLPNESGDSASIDSKVVGNLSGSHALGTKGFNGLDADVQASVQRHMLRISHNLKILNAVIDLIPVDVVNDLSRHKLTPEMLFHNPAMLKDRGISANGDDPVSIGIDAATSIVRVVASVAAKNTPFFELGHSGGLPVNTNPTRDTLIPGSIGIVGGLPGHVDGPMLGGADIAAVGIRSPKDQRGVAGNGGPAKTTIDGKHVVTPTSDDVPGAVGSEIPSAPTTVSKNSSSVKQAETQQPTAGGGVAAEAKGKRVKPKATGLRAKMEAARQARADYFTPGNIVTTYGGHDEVLSYTPPKEDGSGWNVRVQEVKKVDGQWVRQGKPQDARVHATQPDARALAAGPVDKLEHQPAAEVVYSEPRADGKPFPNAVDRGVAPVEEKAPDPAKSKIADFGEKIGGAKKEKAELEQAAVLADWPDQPKLEELRKKHQEVLKNLSSAGVATTADGETLDGAMGAIPDTTANTTDVAFSRPRFSRGAQSQANESVERLATGIASHWENAPKVVVAFDMNDPIIPENVRKEDQRQRSGGATGTPEGFYYKGTVYLMSSKLVTPNDIARVLFHEALGHYGLRGTFGKALRPILRDVAMLRRAEVDAKIKQYGLKMGNTLDRFTAAEEVLAELAQTKPEIGFVQRAIAAIRTWLRQNVPGFNNMRLSDNELIQNYILPARAWVERGGPGGGGGGLPAMSRADQTDTPAFRKWFSPRPGDVIAGAPESVVNSLKTHAKALANFLESEAVTSHGDGKINIPSSVLSHMVGAVRDDKILDAIIRAIPVDVVNFLERKKHPAKDVLHDVAMLENVFSIDPKANVSLGVDPSGLPLLTVRVIANASAKISGLTDGPFERNAAVLADANDPVLGAHVRNSVNKDLSILRGFGDSKVVDAEGKPLASRSGLVLARKSAMSESRPDSDTGNAKPLADLLVSKTFSLQGLGGLEVPSQREVLNGVIALGDDLKVLRSVVELIPVDVVNILSRKNVAPEMLFSDKAMLKELLSIDSDGSVSTAVKVADALVVAVARMATKGTLIDASMAASNGEKNSASNAGVSDGFHSRIVDEIKPIGNNGQFDPKSVDIRYSMGEALTTAANSVRDVSASTGIGRIANKAVDVLNDRLSYEGTVGIWHKTFGSMFQLAKSHPPFQKVFNAAQDFINDVAYYASEASDLAPKLLPKLEDWKDIGKQPISSADNQAIQAPIFEGTLSWARDESGKPVKMSDLEEAAAKLTTEQKAQRLLRGDHISENVLKMWQGLPIEQFEKNIESKYERDMLRPGVVWTPAELKSMFNLTGVKQANGAYDGQIGLYQEFRNAIDNSLDNTAKVDMLRYAGEPAADLREMILDAPDADTAAVLLRDHLLTVAEDDPGQSESLIEVANNIMEQADRVNKLKAEGYAPLSRFGQYSVDVVVDGKREYFDLFETKEAANQMAAKMRMEFGIGKVQTGTISAKEFQLFQGMTPESMELFGNMLGLDAGGENASDTVFQTYLRFTKNNRSAMKRLMHRKGIAGFSTDTGRVLASFIYSNARLTSSGLHMGTMDKAVQDIPKGQGQLKDAAIELREYIKNPREEAQAMRGLLFAQYLGGNVASMLMNFMQVPTVSLPYLSQFGGVKKATAALLQAMKDQKSDTLEKGLQQALKNADEKGITQPQALHELMAQSRGAATLKSGDGTKMGDAKALANNAMSKFSMGWGKLFGMAEQINRRSTFIAAYRLGIEKGVANPATFAENAVNETQFINNKANKAKFARGAIGGTLMTFKSYSTNYLELLYRLSTKNGPEGKKAALLMLGMLFLMAGAGGMPGAEDAEDLIDGIAQRMGYNLSTKKAKEKFLEEIFGKAIGSFILHGVSGLPGSPIDISGRAGFGNLIPGTGVFMPKASHANDLLEFGGPAAGMLKRFGEAVGHLSTGNVFEAAMAASPVAIANMRKGVDMLDSGMYKDAKGYKVMDTTTGEALAKIAGFQPKAVKDDSEDSYLRLRTKNFYNEYKQAVSARWANGLFENDADQVQEAKDMIASWNEKNPELPMRTNMFAIAQRLKHMKETRETRVLKSSPKVMQSTIRQEIAAEKAAQ